MGHFLVMNKIHFWLWNILRKLQIMDVGDYGEGTNLLNLCRKNVILDTNIVARSLAYGQELDYIVKKRYLGE